MSAFFNLGSLALGLAAWTIAFIAIRRKQPKPMYQLSSFTCCCASLVLQFFEIDHRTDIGDYAAIEDTIEAVIYAAVILAIVTVVLNLLPSIRKERK